MTSRYGRRELVLDGKRPRGLRWQLGQSAATRARLRELHPDANTGCLCGDGLVVLDLDVRSHGFEALTKRERRYGPLPDTFTVITGSNGRHYYFRDRSRSVGSFWIEGGLEVKGRGSQVVAPPSIHPDTGRSYVDDPASPGWGTFAELPSWIAQLAPDAPRQTPANPQRPREPGQGDFFETLSPARYAFDLVGARADRSGFILCPSPLHAPERSPSLRLYDTPERGWTCFRGCCIQPNGRRAGGGIWQFMAHALGYTGELRGVAFLTIREAVTRHYERLLLDAP
jgi:hypothetical protein